MYSVQDVAANLHIPERVVRQYATAARTIIDDHTTRGPNNRLIFDQYAFQVLVEINRLRTEEKLSLNGAVSLVEKSLSKKGEPEQRNNSELIDALRETIRQQEETIRHLRKTVDTLQEQLSQILPLALPKPRHRFWPFGRSIKSIKKNKEN